MGRFAAQHRPLRCKDRSLHGLYLFVLPAWSRNCSDLQIMKLWVLILAGLFLAGCERDLPQRQSTNEGKAAQSAAGGSSNEGKAARSAGR